MVGYKKGPGSRSLSVRDWDYSIDRVRRSETWVGSDRVDRCRVSARSRLKTSCRLDSVRKRLTCPKAPAPEVVECPDWRVFGEQDI